MSRLASVSGIVAVSALKKGKGESEGIRGDSVAPRYSGLRMSRRKRRPVLGLRSEGKDSALMGFCPARLSSED